MDVEIAKVHVDSTPLLPRDGSRSMTGDLNMDENHILSVKNLNNYKVDDAYEVRVRDLGSVVNKEYLNEKFLKVDKDGNYFDLKQNTIKNCEPYYDGLFDDNSLNSKAFVDAEISKLPKSYTDVLKLDGSKAMTGALDIGGFGIKNIKPFVEDDSSQAAFDAQKNDVINFGYFHTERGELKRLINEVGYGALNRNDPEPMEDDINMANHSIINLKDPFNDQDAATKKYVNTTASDYLRKDGTPSMNGNIKMENHRVKHLGNPQNEQDAVNKKFVEDKIKESETGSIDLVNKENVFKKVMDDDLFKEDDDDIHKIGVKNFHLVNKKTYEFKIDYDSNILYYSTRLSIDLIYLDSGNYTIVFEMYVDDGITIYQIEGTSGTLSGVTTKSNIDSTKTRSIIHFSYNGLASGFNDLDIDIKLKSKTDPQTTIYVVVYGVKGNVNDVSVSLWDRLYYYDNDSIEYEVPINMDGKDIIDVNKITTKYLDVNDNIDMKNKQIKNVANRVESGDVINKAQLDHVKSNIATNKNDILTIEANNGYYWLAHNNEHTVKFPTVNKHPYLNRQTSSNLRISLIGYYQIIYNDFYQNPGRFVIRNDATAKDLFDISLFSVSSLTPISMNAVIHIDHVVSRVRIFAESISKIHKCSLDGAGYSSFFIKYLGP